jgi:dipeptidyl aminopeptidase/acylaminoacyl peptidase
MSLDMPQNVRRWLLDPQGVPRMVVTYKSGRQKIYWRTDASAGWTEVADFDPLAADGFEPLHIDDQGRVLVLARHGADTEALYRFDPTTRKLDAEPLIRVSGFDLSPELDVDRTTGRLLGVHFDVDQPASYWLDADMQRLQRGIDSALPGRNNRIHCGKCVGDRFYVVHSRSDRQPGEYFLFDRSQGSLARIGAARPWIDEAAQGRRSFHRIPARDGMSLPLYVTRPAQADGKSALPTVVLVHGGPWVRGTNLNWHAEAQFLASRGYLVLEPEFRGSTGYGATLFEAGWKQWGRAMQDDLADALAWAVKQGMADAGRACIVGASYGGYAALMGPIAHPGTYRCAASFAGVTDVELMYDITWSDLSEATRQYSMPVLIGDRIKDAVRLAEVSPLKQAAKIKVPVLVAYGGEDRRVPLEHAKKFIAAAQAAQVAVEVVSYPHEGHGFFDPVDESDYFGRLERFLAKSLQR